MTAEVLRSWSDGVTKRAIVELALKQAEADSWTAISMKNDWTTIF